MSENLTFGVRLAWDGKQAVTGINETQGAMDKLSQSTLTAATSAEKLNESQRSRRNLVNEANALEANLSDKLKAQAAGFAATTASLRQNSAAVTETSGAVSKLLDRYDPLGAKLRQLQTDFKALDAAAGSGKVAARDDARLDAVYAKIQKEITAAKGAAGGFGEAANDAFENAAKGANKSMFATVGARRELMVLAHEAISGNFARMPGSFMVLAERTHLSMASLMGFGGAALAVAASAAVMLYAVHQGAEEMHSMDRALASTSNFAGLTRGEMRGLAADMRSASQLTIGQSKEVVTELAASGRIGAAAFGAVAGLVDSYARATGQSAAEATPKLIQMFEDPTRGAEQLNKSMHFLTVAQMNHIRALQESGKETEAQLVLADALKGRISLQTEHIGTLSSAWNSLRKSASGAWDSMMGIGRAATLEEKIAGLRGKVDTLSVQAPGSQEYLKAQDELNKALADQEKASAHATQQGVNAAKIDEANKANALILRYSVESQKEELRQKIALMQKHPEIDNQADAIARAKKQLAELGAAKKENLNPHLAGVDSDFYSALQAQSAAYQQGAMDIEAYRERVAALIATKTELGRKLAKEDEPFALNKAIEEANKDLEKRRNEISKAGADTSQKLLEETQKNNIALIQDDRTRALAQFDLAKEAWQKKVEIERSGLALYAEGSTGREDAARHLAETEVAYAQWTQSEIARINGQTTGFDDVWGGAAKGALDYQQTAMNAAKSSRDFFSRSFKSMEDAVVQFAMTGKANLRDFANMAIQEFYRVNLARPLVGALSGAFQGAAGSLAGQFSTSQTYGTSMFSQQTSMLAAQTYGMHSGGIVGQDSSFARAAPISLWAGAPSYHTGGIIGPGERPIIAQDGEEMLTRTDPRHRYNQRNAPAAETSAPVTLVYSPNIQIDARNATPGMEQIIGRVVNQAVEQTRASLMAEMGSGGQFALATGRRRR